MLDTSSLYAPGVSRTAWPLVPRPSPTTASRYSGAENVAKRVHAEFAEELRKRFAHDHAIFQRVPQAGRRIDAAAVHDPRTVSRRA